MYWSWWGMAWFWWLFWVIAIIGFTAFLVPVPRGRVQDLDDPLRILARRYAAGELTHEEYEERRMRLERDLSKRPASAKPVETTTTTAPPATRIDTTTPQPT